MTDEKPRVLLFGAGSVGAVYLYLLSKYCSTTAVCRSNYEIVKEKGFIINSSIFGQNLHFKPNVVRSCEEAAAQDDKPFDYILVCSKAIPGICPSLLKPAITQGKTAIVLLQNGIGIEDEWAEAFPDNPIVSAAVYCKTTQRPPGIILHDEVERLEIGAFPSDVPSNHAEDFTSLMQAAGGNAEFHADVQLKRWTKLMANASWNPLCALTRCTDVDFLRSSSTAPDFVLDLMLEVCDVAQAYGYDLKREDAEWMLGRAKARIGKGNAVEPSMLQDAIEGRVMEVDAIMGNVIKMGKAKGVVCTKLETVYVLLQALDFGFAEKAK